MKKEDDIQQLNERIRILEQENEILAENREELLLLGLISEQVEAEQDEKQLLSAALEKTSILKNIPFCAVITHSDAGCKMLCSYSTIHQEDISDQQLDLKPALEQCFANGAEVIDAADGNTLFYLHHTDISFTAGSFITIPFRSLFVPNGLFLFAFENGPDDGVSGQLMLLQRAVEMIVTKMDNRSLLRQLEQQNRALDDKVREKTAELQASNQSLTKNIEEQKQLKAQFYQAQKMEAIGNLAGGVAHDFNNILTVINGYSELLLLQTQNDDPNYARIQEIHSAGKRAAYLTNQLLAFSRKQVIKPVPVNVNELLTDSEKMLKRLIGEHIQFQTVMEPELCTIQADPGQLNQILLNLAVNARDAMPQGGTLTVRTHAADIKPDKDAPEFEFSPGRFLCLSVQDTGTGMDEETRLHIFEPFYTTKPLGEGTGLGLSTVFGIVQQNKGLIEVQSTPRTGTTFYVYLPCCSDKSVSNGSNLPELQQTRQNECILVVEDDDNVRQLTLRVLESAGYQVLIAESTQEALQNLDQAMPPVDLLLTDVIMPGGSGKELVGQARKKHPRLKVLYMSGYTDDILARQGVLPNEVELLNKPFATHELLGHIRKLLAG